MKPTADPLADIALPQRPEFGRALGLIGCPVLELADQSGRIRAQAMMRKVGPIWLALVSRGPVGLDPTISAEDWSNGLRDLRQKLPPRTVLLATPETSLPSLKGLPVMTPATLAILDLQGSSGDQLTRTLASLRGRTKDDTVILMMEVWDEAT